MHVFFDISEYGATPGMLKRELNNILKACWLHVGTFWHQRYRGKHFTKEGAMEYGYAPRSRWYEAEKRRKQGHADPLTFSGASKIRTMGLDVRATSKGCRIVLHAPALNFRRPNMKADMRKEMTTVSGREWHEMKNQFGYEFYRQCGRLKYKGRNPITGRFETAA
jgi:hypothetical protein